MDSCKSGSSWLRWLTYGALVVVTAGSLACQEGLQLFAMIFNTASLGGDIPGGRADLQVKFVNQTPYRPVFTFGTYDPLNDRPYNELYFPFKFEQFVIDTSDGGRRLDAYSESEVITFTAESFGDPGGCGRAIGLGSEELIERIEDDEDALEEAQPEALRPLCNEASDEPRAGIAFFRETSAGPGENACDTKDEIAAWADPVIILQGEPIINVTGDVRYPCDGSLVVFTFVEDVTQDGGIRVDVSIEPPEEEE